MAMSWSQWFGSDLRIVMLDIGQGDAFLIRTPGDRDILIDGGPDRSILTELGAVLPPWDRTLELVVATHDDKDHIAGIAELRDIYNVKTLLRNPQDHPTAFADALDEWKTHDTRVIEAYRTDRIDIEEDLWLEILHPVRDVTYNESNAASLVIMLHYKKITMLFTGDATIEAEEDMLAVGHTHGFDVDVLKVAHHGSHSSTSWGFVTATQPEIALISAGADNSYGHPHAGPLARLQRIGAQIFRTDRDGRVLCRSDGFRIICNSIVP